MATKTSFSSQSPLQMIYALPQHSILDENQSRYLKYLTVADNLIYQKFHYLKIFEEFTKCNECLLSDYQQTILKSFLEPNIISNISMAKGLRSKIQMRWRKLKREYVDKVVLRQKQVKIAQTLSKAALGLQYKQKQAKNGFLYPNDPESAFPQVKPAPIIDLRSTSIPGSGRQWSGANRKHKTITEEYKPIEELDIQENQIQAYQSQKEMEQKIDQEKAVEQKMVDQSSRPKAGSSHKVKKQKKSKLRKTIVF